jgi:hypothetical protein
MRNQNHLKFTFFLLTVLFLNSAIVSSQTKNITSIDFEYNGGNIANNSVKISFNFNNYHDNYVIVKSEVRSVKSEKKISREKFNSICNALLKISSKDLVNSFGSWLDSASTSISFGDLSNRIKYRIEGLGSSDKDTGYKDFLEATLLILEAADAKIGEIN